MTTADISIIVLAGGRSSRFGRDKLAEPLDGRPLLHHAIDAVRPIAAEIIVVAAPDASPAVPPDVTLVNDVVAFEGPLAGVLGGLAVARSPTVLVVGGDMPALSIAVLGSMVALLTESDANAVVLEDGGLGRPLPMALRRKSGLTTASALFAGGERRLRALADALSAAVLSEAAWRALDPDGQTLRDVDTEADLA
jgi:molybdopterin-guanine dinucleotide biosynthesis protein A